LQINGAILIELGMYIQGGQAGRQAAATPIPETLYSVVVHNQ
jgi:hypothetical protein